MYFLFLILLELVAMSWVRNSLTFLKKYNEHFRRIHSLKNLKPNLQLGGIVVTTASSLITFGVFVYYAAEEEPKKKKLVVLGSGWGAVSLLKSLKPGDYDVSVVSPDNYFLFTPLLPGVTVGTVEGRSIIEPVRKIIAKRHKNNARFFEAECIQIDLDKNQVVCKDQTGSYLFYLDNLCSMFPIYVRSRSFVLLL